MHGKRQHCCFSEVVPVTDLGLHHTAYTSVIGREPGPGLRMFSAKFFHYHFLLTYTRGPSQVSNDHSQLGAFRPQGAKKDLFGSKIRYIQILCHRDVRNILF